MGTLEWKKNAMVTVWNHCEQCHKPYHEHNIKLFAYLISTFVRTFFSCKKIMEPEIKV